MQRSTAAIAGVVAVAFLSISAVASAEPSTPSKRQTPQVITGALTGLPSATTEDSGCGPEAFRQASRRLSAEIGEINAERRSEFQKKLSLLRQGHGWSAREASNYLAPMLQSDEILTLDAKNAILVETINGLSATGAKQQRCTALETLKQLLQQLLANTREKWRALHAVMDDALISVRQAQAN